MHWLITIYAIFTGLALTDSADCFLQTHCNPTQSLDMLVLQFFLLNLYNHLLVFLQGYSVECCFPPPTFSFFLLFIAAEDLKIFNRFTCHCFPHKPQIKARTLFLLEWLHLSTEFWWSLQNINFIVSNTDKELPATIIGTWLREPYSVCSGHRQQEWFPQFLPILSQMYALCFQTLQIHI